MEAGNVIRADVLVVGGGTAGCVAALAAAEEGAKVVLIESDSALGGVATRGGIHRYYYGSPGGLQELIDRRTEETAKLFGGETMGFHPEAKRVALSALCAERGVVVHLDTVVYKVLMEGEDVAGALALAPAGDLRIEAAATIDCSGNGSLARMAGAKLHYGRELDGAYHNYSLIPRRLRDGLIGYDNLDAGWVDPYDPWDVSRAFTSGREWIREGYAQGQHYFGISSMLGVREGGRIQGDATITIRDYIEDVPSEEIICRSYSHLDNHGFDTGNETEFSQLWISVLGLFVKGLWCDIPYGSLLPKGIGRLLVGGRALSADRDVSMGVRMQKDMHKTGEAAGVAAAMSAREGCSPRELDIGMLRERLLARGVMAAGDLRRTAGRNLVFRGGALAGSSVPGNGETRYRAEELVPYLETEERWKAIWLLARSKRDDEQNRDEERSAVDLLVGMLEKGTPEGSFCAAVTLAMMNRQEAVPFLLRTIAERSPNKLSNHHKCVPFWIASFVLLRMLRKPEAAGQALSALKEGVSSSYATFLLDYLSVAAPSLPEEEKKETIAVLREWADNPGLGSDYLMHGERSESLRWSLELRAEAIMAACGARAESDAGLAERARNDRRSYVREAAKRLLKPGRSDEAERLPNSGAVEAGQAANEDSGTDSERDNLLGRFDVAVIGGTAAGVACAAELGRQGLSVVLIESSASLLTEVTRSRQTRCPSVEADCGERHAEERCAGAALLAALKAEGAVADGELEPVLAQLAVDRLLEESGVRVLYETRKLGGVTTEDDHMQVAHKSGTGVIRASRVIDMNGGIGDAASSGGSRIWTATLLGLRLEREQWLTIGEEENKMELRLRPSFYEGETYLDMVRHPHTSLQDNDDAAIAVRAMTELRSQGLIPETAVLAYISDMPWMTESCMIGDSAEAGDRTERGWLLRQLAYGEQAARVQ